MYVCTGSLFVNGRQLEHGDPVPEAASWPPYILENHRKEGRIRDVTPEEAEKLAAAGRAKRQAAQKVQLERNVAESEAAVRSVRSKFEQLAREGAALGKDLEKAQAFLEHARAVLAAFLTATGVATEPVPAPAPASAPAPAAEPEKAIATAAVPPPSAPEVKTESEPVPAPAPASRGHGRGGRGGR